jgi:hypothetical protein
MYWGELECVGRSFACKLGLHPLTFAHFSRIASNFEKLLVVYECYNVLMICIGEIWNAWGRVLLAQ